MTIRRRPMPGQWRCAPGAGLLAMLAVAASPGAARPASPVAPGVTPAAPPLTAARYRTALAPVTTCAAFARHPAALPVATPLLRALVEGGVAEKRPSESDDAFVGRVVQDLFAQLGDPSRLHTAVPVGNDARYDAATHRLTLTLPQPFEARLDRWDAREMLLRGATAPVRTATELHGVFDGSTGLQGMTLPMDAEQARRIASGGATLHILSLFQDYGSDAAYTKPTADRPYATQTSLRLVRLKPKCAVLTSGDAVVPGWLFDAWDAGAN